MKGLSTTGFLHVMDPETGMGFLRVVPSATATSHPLCLNKSDRMAQPSRWRDDSGPIGQAIRAGRKDLLEAAIRKTKINNTSH